MALLAANQIRKVHQDGNTDAMILFSVSKCNTSDTVDVSTWFLDAKLATVLWTTTAKRDALATPASNIVTLSTASLANDAGWLMVWGSVIP